MGRAHRSYPPGAGGGRPWRSWRADPGLARGARRPPRALLPPHLTLCYRAPHAPPERSRHRSATRFHRPVVVRLGGVTALPNRDGTLVVEVLDAADLDQARRRLFDATHAAMGGYGNGRGTSPGCATASNATAPRCWPWPSTTCVSIRRGPSTRNPARAPRRPLRVRRRVVSPRTRAAMRATRGQRAVLLATAALHACNDAFFYVLYPLLPFIAAELSLSYTEVGLVNLAFPAAAACCNYRGAARPTLGRVRAAGLGERLGRPDSARWPRPRAFRCCSGWPCWRAWAGTYSTRSRRRWLLARTPVADADWRSGPSISPGISASSRRLASSRSWRPGLAGASRWSASGCSASCSRRRLVWLTGGSVRQALSVGSASERHAGRWTALPKSFGLLNAVGMLDATTRTAALTFLPFVFANRGMGVGEIGLLFGVMFAGGALGKLLCGPLGDRFGGFAVVLATETTTALALCGLAWGPTGAAIGLALVLGFGLNGTSSVLYAAVATFVPHTRHGAGYGIYYTTTQSPRPSPHSRTGSSPTTLAWIGRSRRWPCSRLRSCRSQRPSAGSWRSPEHAGRAVQRGGHR